MTAITTTAYFGGCPKCGKTNGIINAYGSHWGLCDAHKTKWSIGAGLFSSWTNENEEVWARNAEKLKDFEAVEPVYPRKEAAW